MCHLNGIVAVRRHDLLFAKLQYREIGNVIFFISVQTNANKTIICIHLLIFLMNQACVCGELDLIVKLI